MAQYITAEELKDLIINFPETVAVIDVRDDDHVGGHILGSKNYPSRTLPNKIPEIIKETSKADKIVFHCSLSQQRGPKASSLFKEALETSDKQDNKPTVLVLEGGFVNWHNKGFSKDTQLTENYDSEHWRYGFQG